MSSDEYILEVKQGFCVQMNFAGPKQNLENLMEFFYELGYPLKMEEDIFAQEGPNINVLVQLYPISSWDVLFKIIEIFRGTRSSLAFISQNSCAFDLLTGFILNAVIINGAEIFEGGEENINLNYLEECFKLSSET